MEVTITPNETAAIEETRRLIKESLVVEKLLSRVNHGKNADVLCADADGTLYVRSRQTPYIGRNIETANQIKEKDLPFIVNTARPGWILESDADLIQNMKLPLPDAVIAGAGTMVYWRNKNGELVTDSVYFNRMENHKVGMKNDGDEVITKFDPDKIIRFLYPSLVEFSSKGLAQILVDPGPVASDGRVGIGGIRFVAKDMSYSDLAKFNENVGSKISGIKLQLSEITEMTTADDFTGWIHLIPSIAGKDRAFKYMLEAVGEQVESKITGHTVGDTSIDIPMLAMGTKEEPGSYLIRQYAVSNLPPRTREKLEKVAGSLANKDDFPGKHLHLTMLKEKGPDAVFAIVDKIN